MARQQNRYVAKDSARHVNVGLFLPATRGKDAASTQMPDVCSSRRHKLIQQETVV